MRNGSAGRIAINLRVERARKRLTQNSLAELAGIGPQTIYRFETGQREPRVGQLIRIARALGVKPSTLIDDVDGTE